MKRVLLAYGDVEPEEYIKKLGSKFDYEVIGQCVYREEILSKVNKLKPDILMLRESIRGDISIDEIIEGIKMEYDFCRIILLASDHQEGDDFLKTIISRGVYDIVAGDSVNISSLITLINQPNSYKDVAHLQGLKKINKETENNVEVESIVKIPATAVSINNDKSLNVGIQGAYTNTSVMQELSTTENTSYQAEPNTQYNYQETPQNNNTDVFDNNGYNFNQYNYNYQDNYNNEQFVTADSSSNTSYYDSDTGDAPTSILTSENNENWYNNDLSFVFEPVENQPYFTEVDNGLVAYQNKQASNQVNYQENKVLTGDNSLSNKTIHYFNKRNSRMKVMAYVGVKSGLGCTSTCLNVAKTLSEASKRVLVIDAVFNYGVSDIFNSLGLNEIGHFEDVLSDFFNGKRGTIKNYVTAQNYIKTYYGNAQNYKTLLNVTNNIDYISFNPNFEDNRDLAVIIPALLDSIDVYYDFVLVDICLDCHSLYISEFLRTADRVYLCTNQDLNSMFKSKVILDEYKFIFNKLSVVVNRYNHKLYPADNIARYFNVNKCYPIPCDNDNCIKASISKNIQVMTSKKIKSATRKYVIDVCANG